jgi:serine protease Do
MEKHVVQLTQWALARTVSVRVGHAQGSGVIVSPDGYVLSAAHLVGEPNRKAIFILSDGRLAEGKTLGRNSDIDAGLMKITSTELDGNKIAWPFAELGSSSNLHAGQWCLAIGHTGGYAVGRKPAVRLGCVLSCTDSFIMTDCKLQGGDSGGPLFDLSGAVIGIHSRIGVPLEANLHVPVDTYRQTWDRLAAGQAWGGQPFIGVEGDPNYQQAKIARVLAGGAAEKAGVQAGDIITRFGDRQVKDFGSLAALVSEMAPGDKVKVQILRGGETIELPLVVGRQEERTAW